jgi:hypothetical protein
MNGWPETARIQSSSFLLENNAKLEEEDDENEPKHAFSDGHLIRVEVAVQSHCRSRLKPNPPQRGEFHRRDFTSSSRCPRS